MTITNEQEFKINQEAARRYPMSGLGLNLDGDMNACRKIFAAGAAYGLTLPSTPAHSEAVEVLGVGFWFMHERFTFTKIEGRTVEEIRDNMLYVANGNKYGMVCSASVTINKTETKPCEESVGGNVHGDKDGKYDLSDWYETISKDERIMNFLRTKTK